MNNLNKEESKHVNKEDYVTVLFHLGFSTKGAKINYYFNLTSKNFGELEQQIQCEHGRITIECYDEIVQRAESWEGNCGCINFNLKKRFLDIFLKQRTKYYCQFKTNNSPFRTFFAC